MIQSNPAGDEIMSGMKTKAEVTKCVTNEIYGAGVNAQFEFFGTTNEAFRRLGIN